MTGNNLPPNILDTTADCEIVSSRVIHFPIDLVFRAWTEPEHLQNWWGQQDFKNEENFDRLEAELSKMNL